jgi:hypothetical protein
MSADNEEIAAAIEARNRFMNRLRSAESPEERMVRFYRLQARAMEVLLSSPEGYQHFLRRNFHARRAEVVDGEWRPVSPDRRRSRQA